MAKESGAPPEMDTVTQLEGLMDRAWKHARENEDLTGILSGMAAGLGRLIKERDTYRNSATVDQVTGVLNRQALETALNREISRTLREEDYEVCVLFIDIDHFKEVNDKYGHPAGDQILKSVSRRIQETIRTYDILGRYDGEELVVILPKAELNDAIKAAERIRKNIEETIFEFEGKKINITVSIGTATSKDIDQAEQHTIRGNLIHAADFSMYAAKAKGRNQVWVSIGGVYLTAEQALTVLSTPEVISIIERHRKGLLEITGGNGDKKDAIERYLIAVAEGHQETFRIIDKGGASPVQTAFISGPRDGRSINIVHDTSRQIQEQLEENPLSVIPYPEQQLFLTGPGTLNFLNLLLTHACPMNCVYCTQEHISAQRNELEIEFWKKAIDEATDNGNRRGVILGLTGGEPLTIKVVLLELIEYAKQRGMFVTMNTNAYLLNNEETVDAIIATGIDVMNISLDSHIAATENRITRKKKSYGRIINGLKLLAKAQQEGRPRIMINHVITNQNVGQFLEFIEWMVTIRQQEGLVFGINPLPVKDAQDLYLDLEQIREFNRLLVPEIRRIAQENDLTLLAMKIGEIFGADENKGDRRFEREMAATRGTYFGAGSARIVCATALTSATINPQGNVFPCTYHRERDPKHPDIVMIGNIRESTIREMQERYFDVLSRLPNANRVCLGCCGPDVRRLNKGIIDHLKVRGVIRR